MFSQKLIQATARLNMPACVGLRDLASSEGQPVQAEAQKLEELARRDYEVTIQLEQEVSKLRLVTLRGGYRTLRPEPLDHPDLAFVQADKHGLVDLSQFDQRRGGLAIGRSVFEVLPAISSRNSSYWTLLALNSLPAGASPRIRLDPLMCSAREGYRAMFYAMNVFGPPLTWRNILDLPQEVSQRWMPDAPDKSEVAFTDAIWTPRKGEVHLRCEECPKAMAAEFRPSRYFHAVIDRKGETVVHCDGALRLFSREEADERSTMHVRDAGKIGTRVKLFQIDAKVDSKFWAALFKSFFIWNRDIEKFADALAAD
jgi:hypothetical protein